MSQESIVRLKQAGRILVQTICGGGQPILLSEVAQLRLLAESDEERTIMPLAKLARVVIERERRRIGIPPPDARQLGAARNN